MAHQHYSITITVTVTRKDLASYFWTEGRKLIRSAPDDRKLVAWIFVCWWWARIRLFGPPGLPSDRQAG